MGFNWRSHVVTKKALPYLLAAPRAVLAATAGSDGYNTRPVLLANSFPKSGTHLLVQIFKSLPGVRDWGMFLASQPSVPFRRVPDARLAATIDRLAPGELAGAHLHHSEAAGAALGRCNAVHCFIYRDLRDVAVSEAHYLAHMNRFHRMHKYFRDLPDDQARYRLALEGKPDEPELQYPNIVERFKPYAGWLQESDVFSLRYEDLMGPQRAEVLAGIVAAYARRAGLEDSATAGLVHRAEQVIDPQGSHTFRSGRTGGWREALGPELQASFLRMADGLNASLGYPDD